MLKNLLEFNQLLDKSYAQVWMYDGRTARWSPFQIWKAIS